MLTTRAGAVVVAHGGGPTAVLNASLAGVIEEARIQSLAIVGARHGVEGLIRQEFLDLTDADLASLRCAPGSAIGSSRKELADVDAVLDTFAKRDVRLFIYTGGNGSMETALRVHRAAQDRKYELQVIGVPKTIDNDLSGTDHAPGHASAARFFAHAVRDIGEDNYSLPPPVCVLECLGRNAGWIAASTALARNHEDEAPHIICLPEHPVNEDQLMAAIETVYRRLGRVVVVACEGQTNDKGQPFGADVDKANSAVHRLASNLGYSLAKLITVRTGLRARAEKPGLFGRSCALLASDVDREESYECGRAAIRAAVSGLSGVMISLQRESNEPYRATTTTVPLECVARRERLFPTEWVASGGLDVRPEYLPYIKPLAGPVKPHYRIP